MIRKFAVCLLLLGLLSSCGVVKVKKPPEPAPTVMPQAIRFEGGNEGDEPAGWRVQAFSQGSNPEDTPNHKLELTKSQRRGGEMSLHLRPVGEAEESANSHAQLCAHSPFPGSAVRVSAFLKGDADAPVTFGVGYTGANSNPVNNLILPAGGWTKADVVNPAGPRPSALGVLELCVWFGAGAGEHAWIDEITFTKVDLAALPPEKTQPVPLENLDMEQFDRRGRLENWALTGDLFSEPAPGYELRADRQTKRSGEASLLVTAAEGGQGAGNTSAAYCLDPQAFRGKKLRIAGWLKADVAERATASLGATTAPIAKEEVAALPVEELHKKGDFVSSYTYVSQLADWSRFEQVLAVPMSAETFCVTVSVGHGSLWADDLSVDVLAI